MRLKRYSNDAYRAGSVSGPVDAGRGGGTLWRDFGMNEPPPGYHRAGALQGYCSRPATAERGLCGDALLAGRSPAGVNRFPAQVPNEQQNWATQRLRGEPDGTVGYVVAATRADAPSRRREAVSLSARDTRLCVPLQPGGRLARRARQPRGTRANHPGPKTRSAAERR